MTAQSQNTHDLYDDDTPVGRVLSRREMLALLGGGSAAVFAGLNLPKITGIQRPAAASRSAAQLSCVARPELAAGPFFVDEQLQRFDIRVDPRDNSIKAGLPFYLVCNVSAVRDGQCVPIEGAIVDLWHCDAAGVYSGVQDRSSDTTDEMWLRGYQVTGEDGSAEFLTIIPGWYSGRAVHIHIKIRVETESGETYDFTSQLFFEPELIEEAYVDSPYTERGLPDRPNSSDSIYRASDGQLTLALQPMDDEQLEALAEAWLEARPEEFEDETLEFETAYVATFDIGLDLSDT